MTRTPPASPARRMRPGPAQGLRHGLVRPGRCSSDAFTLFEVIVVVVIVAVLSAAVVPSITALMGRQDSMQARGDVIAFLAAQRQESIRSGNVRWLRWEAGGHRLVAGVDLQPVDQQVALPEQTEITENGFTRLEDRYFETVESSLADAGWSDEVLFYPDGTTTEATLTFELDNRTQTITLHAWSGVIE